MFQAISVSTSCVLPPIVALLLIILCPKHPSFVHIVS